MAVKKGTAAKRPTTTKRSKSTKTATKRTTKAKSAAKRAPAEHAPAVYTPPVRPAEPAHSVESPRTASAPMGTDPRPSVFTGDHYLHVAGPKPADGTARRPGKWLIFVSRSRVDALWTEIRRAVERGRLGHAAKVSTALPDPMSPDPKKHAIYVYTANEDDAVDVRRVREVLRQLGIGWKIPYKSDATPAAAAKYFE
jgi:hypothetical protein